MAQVNANVQSPCLDALHCLPDNDVIDRREAFHDRGPGPDVKALEEKSRGLHSLEPPPPDTAASFQNPACSFCKVPVDVNCAFCEPAVGSRSHY